MILFSETELFRAFNIRHPSIPRVNNFSVTMMLYLYERRGKIVDRIWSSQKFEPRSDFYKGRRDSRPEPINLVEIDSCDTLSNLSLM